MLRLLPLLSLTLLVIAHEAAHAQYVPSALLCTGLLPAGLLPASASPARIHVSGWSALLCGSARLQFSELRDAGSIQAVLALTHLKVPRHAYPTPDD